MAKPVVVVTGVSGNLGSRLLPLLGSYSVIGVDVSPPHTDSELQFESLDLGQESSTRTLYELLRDTHPYAVIHLAFVIDPVRTGVLDVDRMWQINVAGTARVMEAVTEANRTRRTMESSSSFFPAACPPTGQTCRSGHRRLCLWRPIHCRTQSTKSNRTKWCSSVRGLARMQRLHLAAAHFCRRERRELSDGRVPRHAERNRTARGKDAQRGQAAALYVAARPAISRQQDPVHPRRRHGTADHAHPAARTRARSG